MWWLTAVIPVLGSHTHTFNSNTRDVEKGRNMAGWKEEYKVGGDGTFILRTFRDRTPQWF